MRGALGSLVVVTGFSLACGMAPNRAAIDGGSPAQQDGDSGVQQPPPAVADAGAALDGGVQQPPSTLDGGGPPPAPDGGTLTFDPAVLPGPPAPTPDDPAACAPRALPFPVPYAAQPDRPCTEEGSIQDGGFGWTASYRYDATGRLVQSESHSNDGDSTYTLEDDGGVRIETLVQQGVVSFRTRDVTLLEGGNPVQADHFRGDADGGLVLTERSTWQYDAAGRQVESDHFKADADGGLAGDGHTTWLYDAEGRQQYVISQYAGQARRVERHVYDSKGHEYYLDVSHYWPGATQLANHLFTVRSWFANGTPAHLYRTCDIVGGPSCGIRETRWEPCGNVSYDGDQTGNGSTRLRTPGTSKGAWSTNRSTEAVSFTPASTPKGG